MFAWLLLTLLALVSAQVEICASGSAADDDLLARLINDFATVERPAELPTRTFSARVEITTKAEYDAQVNAIFAAHAELTVEQQNQIAAEAEARMAAIETRFRALSILDRTLTLTCITTRAIVFGTTLETIRLTVEGYLELYFQAFTGYQVAVEAYFDGWVAVVEGHNAATIIAEDLKRQTLTLTQAVKDIQFYVANTEQKVRLDIVAAAETGHAWLQAEASADAQLAAKRAAAKASIEAVIIARVNLRRAGELKIAYEAYLNEKKAELEAAADAVEAKINRAWAEARAELILAFENAAAKIEQWRMEFADRLAGIQCDTSALTITAVTEGDAVRIQFRGFVCYSDRPEAEVKSIVCASAEAYILVNGALIRADAYGCQTVTQKRSLEQGGGTAVDADVVGSDPGTTPEPTTSNSVSVVACFLLLLLSVLFHF
jgi:hypothetical protein